jgi:steroid delta-isomerase-like uncharacterized protein
MATDVTRLDANKRLVRRLHEAVWNEGDLNVVDEVIAEDYVEHNPAVPEEIRGREAYKANVTAFREAFSGFDIVIEDVIAEGDIVVVRHAGRGTHENEFMGIEPTGRSFEISGVVVLRIENDQVAEAWVNIDALGLLVQLGAITPPGAEGTAA